MVIKVPKSKLRKYYKVVNLLAG